MNEKPILIKLHKKQIVNDVRTECSIMGRILQRNPETEEQGAEIMTPEDELTKAVVARAITEGFGEVKRVCQRYLIMGKDVDDNRLEEIDEREKYSETIAGKQGRYILLAKRPYLIHIESAHPVLVYSCENELIGEIDLVGTIKHTPTKTGSISIETASNSVKTTYVHGNYGTLELELSVPCSFNIGMTGTVKDYAHRMIVDHVVYSLLFNQWPEKALVYKERFNADMEGLKKAMQARTCFSRNAPDWS